MSRWKNRMSYVKEGLFAAFLGSVAAIMITHSQSMDGVRGGRKTGLVVLLWGWPLGLLCAALAVYSLVKIYRMATGATPELKS